MEAVRVASRGIVPFQHQHLLACVLGEKSGHGEASDSRPDHDRIPLIFQGLLFVGEHFSSSLPAVC